MRLFTISLGLIVSLACHNSLAPSTEELHMLTGEGHTLSLQLRQGRTDASWITIDGANAYISPHLCTSREREGIIRDRHRTIRIVQDGSDLGIC
jgi:hypothetical protein